MMSRPSCNVDWIDVAGVAGSIEKASHYGGSHRRKNNDTVSLKDNFAVGCRSVIREKLLHSPKHEDSTGTLDKYYQQIYVT